MLQDPNVERYIEIAVNPLKKEIEQMKAQIEALNQALRIHDAAGENEQCVLHATDWNGKCFKCGEQVFVRESK
jgi:acetolactate synthase small subunit